MQSKINNIKSSVLDLAGGGPQGSLLGQLLYIIGSDDVVEERHHIQERSGGEKLSRIYHPVS